MTASPEQHFDLYLSLVRARVSDKTLSHCLGVSRLMADVAARTGYCRETAALAGLLHDIHKKTSEAELLALAEKWDVPITDYQHEHPKLLHGPVAAAECRRELGIESDDIIEAICWHTTGRPGMGLCALIMYFADFAESGRTMPESTEARRILDADGFVAALRYVAAAKLGYLHGKTTMDPMTTAFSAWLDESTDNMLLQEIA
jgi:predicted HD superfamily hydrolase involved in NAD metabolism